MAFSNFNILHADGRNLIKGWFEKAWQCREVDGDDAFEAFIYAWFAVNGWAACVTGDDRDSVLVRSLAADRRLSDLFANLVGDDAAFSNHVSRFSELWPIFEVKDLRQLRILRQYSGSRSKMVATYLRAGATAFEPQCWKEHQHRQEPIPFDWWHTLAAIYRVRCNLFHGEKAAHSEMDQAIVVAAFRVLVHFFRGTNLL